MTQQAMIDEKERVTESGSWRWSKGTTNSRSDRATPSFGIPSTYECVDEEEREREESVVPRSNGVDLNRTNLLVSLVLVEIRGVEGKSCLLREDEMAVSIVFHRNGSVRMAREETTFF